jgi:hypothetical protein
VKIWKIVFWLLALITARDFFNLMFSGEAELLDLISLAASLFMLIPYYGYAYQLVIGWKLLWQMGFLLISPFFCYQWGLHTWARISQLVQYFDWVSALFFIAGLVMTLAVVIPPFQYAFRSNALWLENAERE